MRIPITILAGSDHRPGPLPENVADLHSLSTIYKGAEVKINDRSLIEILVESLKQSGKFWPITIAGPAEIYEPLNLEATIVDTNGSVATNLRAAMEHHVAEHGELPAAFLAYDVLLSPAELDQLHQLYLDESPCCVWVPFVEMPANKEELGAFGWKPTYGLLPAKDESEIQVLPGHLGIFRPETMRLELLYQILDLAYETRNHSVSDRRKIMVRKIIGKLLKEDLKSLARFQLPRLTASVISSGLLIAGQLKKSQLTIPQLEKAIGSIFLDPETRLKGPSQGIRHPVVDILSLAEDVDTEEEAAGLA
ncbi:MAG: hypothetical protein P1U89_09440 [Verrucomicrobiales bacterium]|nr:hypothetical protein [Verrucomicrobiales bacterium]